MVSDENQGGSRQFSVRDVDGNARTGAIRLPRGEVKTPVFMPVGTQAAVKALSPADLDSLGAEIVLANTYHLMLRPGADVIQRLGGVSHFMAWNRPVLTDSGGFQVFSLAHNRELSSEGVTFRSHIDGSEHQLTPEQAITLQHQFGSDIIMALDVCTGHDSSPAEQRRAADLTHQWLPRNVEAFQECVEGLSYPRSLLFGICQGGFDGEQRAESARIVADSIVDGIAIGGLSVGEPKEVMAEMLARSIEHLPPDRPRYLMGVGSPEDLWNAVAKGVDMFDCVLPTRAARHGGLYTPTGRINIKGARYREQNEPVDPTCDCVTCATFSAAYVHHLFRTGELLAYRLATIHNLRFLVRQIETMREAIASATFEDHWKSFLESYRPADQATAREQRAKFRQRWSETDAS